jgi:hypothetical protein
MTQAWSIPPDLFAGETVAVICKSPGVEDLLDSVSQYKRIAVRRAFELVPDADMLVALDGPTGSLDDDFWKDAADFAGIKICGVECDVDAKFIGTYYDDVVIGPAHTISIRNNGLFGIRCAAMGGAAKILLVGFDPARYEALHAPWFGLVKGIEQVTAELRARGIEVERVESANRILTKSEARALERMPDASR